MRQVDSEWPAPGSELHHSVGAWPLLLDDRTVSLERTPTSLTVRAKGWPLGEARVRIEVRTSGDGCLVRLQEEPTRGPARWIPRPVREPALRLRNQEALRRLAFLSEGRAAAVNPPGRMPEAG
ncbi:SRPBCC family protein [Agromyces sp. NPDC060279]|uniref:SRPBCC family protein n=1 Tax=Agromyces sp. NPDC060279 TaxID=3347092 RepID=UPI003647DCAB